MVSPHNSGIWCFVYYIFPCCYAVSGMINLLRSNSFSKKLILFYAHTITFRDYVSLNKCDHPWLISRTAAISLISFNLKNLNPYGTGCNRYSFEG
jgi:hypothetical protein